MPLHTARLVTDLLGQWDWEPPKQPRYSLDWAPADFYLLPGVKESLRGTRMQSPEEINEATSESLRHLAGPDLTALHLSLRAGRVVGRSVSTVAALTQSNFLFVPRLTPN